MPWCLPLPSPLDIFIRVLLGNKYLYVNQPQRWSPLSTPELTLRWRNSMYTLMKFGLHVSPFCTTLAPFSILLPSLSHWGILCRPDLLMLPLSSPINWLAVRAFLWSSPDLCNLGDCSSLGTCSNLRCPLPQEYNVMVTHKDFCQNSCKSWLCLLLSVRLWASYLTSLGLTPSSENWER